MEAPHESQETLTNLSLYDNDVDQEKQTEMEDDGTKLTKKQIWIIMSALCVSIQSTLEGSFLDSWD